MNYGLVVPNVGMFGDARMLADMAYEAEEAGWDGFFLWDTIHYLADNRESVCDPWVALAAIAMRTQRVRIGPMVTPLSRRRPWKLVRETVSLDHLSHGRLTLGVGLGDLADRGLTHFGETTDAKVRAKLLDEGLDVLVGLWSGQPFSYHGEHYHVDEITFLPTPVQSPTIPIWVGGFWPRKGPLQRAMHWDGTYLGKVNEDGTFSDMTVEDVQALYTYVKAHRGAKTPFDIVVSGETPGDNLEQARAKLEPLAEAGATWWLESIGPWRGSLDDIHRRVEQGPLRIK